MTAGLLAAALWAGVLVWVMARSRDSIQLDNYPRELPPGAPLVSVILPARDEATHIVPCLRSILASHWRPLEVIVVDDHSVDGTGELARGTIAAWRRESGAHAAGVTASVIETPPLPPGWFGKQWACHTGVAAAHGRLLLFTDADTRHTPDLLPRCVNAMRARGAALFSVAGRQELASFWEKVVQPYVFSVLFARYGGMERMSRATRPRHKIANGQFLLFDREAYEKVGGHARVRDHVAEDLRLAQEFTRAGFEAHMVLGFDALSTRMYDSLGAIRRGWGKNVYAAGRDTVPAWWGARLAFRALLPLTVLIPLLPLLALAVALLEPGPAAGALAEGLLWFGAVGAAFTTASYLLIYREQRVHPLWGLLHPVAALVFAWICAEAAIRGARVTWKGREYVSR